MNQQNQVHIRFPSSFYEIATELGALLREKLVCTGITFIGAFQEETGIFYYWEIELEEEPWQVRVEKEPYKVTKHTQSHSIWFRQIGTFKWILSDIKDLQTINVVIDLEQMK